MNALCYCPPLVHNISAYLKALGDVKYFPHSLHLKVLGRLGEAFAVSLPTVRIRGKEDEGVGCGFLAWLIREGEMISLEER